jgi:hypothetical protein
VRRARGQALVEAAVAVAVLAVLLAAFPGLLAYQDIQRAALRGARDMSFIAAWYGSAGTTMLEESLDETLAELPWRHPGDGRRLLERVDAHRATLANSPPPGRAATMLDFIAAPLRGGDSHLGEQFDLTQRGFRQVRVDVAVPALRGAMAPFSELSLDLSGEAALLTDAWNAAGSAHVTRRVAGLVPTRKLADAQSAVQALGGILRVIEPTLAQLCPGLIEPELLPQTRLGTRSVRPAASRAGEERCR